jgi:hypothetical protein
MTAPNFDSNFKSFVIIKTPLRLAQHSGQHSGPCGGTLVVLSQHTHPAVLASWLGQSPEAQPEWDNPGFVVATPCMLYSLRVGAGVVLQEEDHVHDYLRGDPCRLIDQLGAFPLHFKLIGPGVPT